MSKTILHVDINSYFASLLQQENPYLRGKPVVVVKELGRTCVIAASKEAKKYGVKTGSTVAEAQQLCSELIVLPAAFDLYLAATRKLKDLFTSLSPDVEIFSLDEVFIQYDALHRLYPSPEAFGRFVQAEIQQVLGAWITSNVGISYNRFLAKMGGETAPKGSVVSVTPKNKDALLARTEFSDVCGIGRRMGRKLEQLGVHTPYGINFIDDAVLQAVFGPFWTEQLKKMAQGEEPLFLERLGEQIEQPMKSVSRSITGFQLCSSEADMRRILYNLATEVMYKVRTMKFAGRQVSISLFGTERRWRNFVTLRRPIWHLQDFFEELEALYEEWQDRFPVIKWRVGLSLLVPWKEAAVPLWPEWRKQEKIETAVTALNNRYGLFTVRSGLLSQGATIIRPEVTGFLGDQAFQLREH